jgi:hypothetical protein
MDCELIKGKSEEKARQICLICPYPRCIFDLERKRRKPKWWERIQRNGLIVKMSVRMTTTELAKEFNLNPRHIRRILRQSRLLEARLKNEADKSCMC